MRPITSLMRVCIAVCLLAPLYFTACVHTLRAPVPTDAEIAAQRAADEEALRQADEVKPEEETATQDAIPLFCHAVTTQKDAVELFDSAYQAIQKFLAFSSTSAGNIRAIADEPERLVDTAVGNTDAATMQRLKADLLKHADRYDHAYEVADRHASNLPRPRVQTPEEGVVYCVVFVAQMQAMDVELVPVVKELNAESEAILDKYHVTQELLQTRIRELNNP